MDLICTLLLFVGVAACAFSPLTLHLVLSLNITSYPLPCSHSNHPPHLAVDSSEPSPLPLDAGASLDATGPAIPEPAVAAAGRLEQVLPPFLFTPHIRF